MKARVLEVLDLGNGRLERDVPPSPLRASRMDLDILAFGGLCSVGLFGICWDDWILLPTVRRKRPVPSSVTSLQSCDVTHHLRSCRERASRAHMQTCSRSNTRIENWTIRQHICRTLFPIRRHTYLHTHTHTHTHTMPGHSDTGQLRKAQRLREAHSNVKGLRNAH